MFVDSGRVSLQPGTHASNITRCYQWTSGTICFCPSLYMLTLYLACGQGVLVRRVVMLLVGTVFSGKAARWKSSISLLRFFKPCVSENTMKDVWKAVVWSLRALHEGRWPEFDHLGNRYAPTSAEGHNAGQYLAGGYRAVVWMIKGDLKFFQTISICAMSTLCDHAIGAHAIV